MFYPNESEKRKKKYKIIDSIEMICDFPFGNGQQNLRFTLIENWKMS